MHRFFIGERDFVDGEHAIVRSPGLIHQWKKVLHFREGERVVLLRGDGEEYEMEIRELKNDEIVLRLIERRFSQGELPVRLVLAQSFLKHVDKFELVLQKGTELGVAAFIPLISERTEKKMEPKRDRWIKILQEAAEQSGRAVIPDLLETTSLQESVSQGALVIVPHPSGEETLQGALKSVALSPSEILCCIGPEGGFTDAEIIAVREAGAHVVTLGPRILRAETASIVVAALIAHITQSASS